MPASASANIPAPQLGYAQVHVWSFSLDAAAEMLDDGYGQLSKDERLRADRFATPVLRSRFIMARASLRGLLGSYLHIQPGRVTIEFGSHGKPRLADDAGIRFNLSHAGNMAMVAVARHREVGVDLERASAGLDFHALARQVFSPAECAALEALSGESMCEAFYRTWVRKEACIKAHGHGFGYPTRSFSVSHWLGDERVLLADDCDEGAAIDLRVSALPAPRGFHAAVAATAHDWTVVRIDGQR